VSRVVVLLPLLVTTGPAWTETARATAATTKARVRLKTMVVMMMMMMMMKKRKCGDVWGRGV
jgi:hypothetical protein